jgi:serine protease Do
MRALVIRSALLFIFLIIASIRFPSAVVAHIADGVPTLAPIVREVTPTVVNISVRGRIKEENPLYRDPLFREFFDLPKQIEHEFQAAGSGVIVDAAHGYILTANHVVAQITSAQVTTKDGRRFVAKLVGRDPATDVAVLQVQGASGLKQIQIGDSGARSRGLRACDR